MRLRRACSRALFAPVDTPAGADRPSLVIAVAVVMFLTMVLLTMRTSGVSSMAMPPPSCVATLLAMMLLLHGHPMDWRVGKPPAIRNRMPPPSSFDRLAMISFVVDRHLAGTGAECRRTVGSSPATMMPPRLVVGLVEVDPVVVDRAAGLRP